MVRGFITASQTVFWALVFFGSTIALAQSPAVSDSSRVSDAPNLQVTEQIGAQLPLETNLIDESGTAVRLGDYFKPGRPVILTPVYYNCPLLCNLVLNGFLQGLKEKGLIPGRGFDVVTFSIDAREKNDVALAKKSSYLETLNAPGAGEGWHFLTTDRTSIKALTERVGFPFRFDDETKQYLHPGAIIFLSGDGQVVRYLYGTYFPGRDLQFALQDAGMETTLASRAERVLFVFEPNRHRYFLSTSRAMFFTFLLSLLCFAPIMYFLWGRLTRRNPVQA